MPKRTNLFQEVVEIIHEHMAGDAEVEASALLPSRSTGALREVDVVIRGRQAGHDLLVSVEAISRSRKADRAWVDGMLGKHADLPTNKLVLVSEKGFTKDAREAAAVAGAVTLAPEDLEGDTESAVVKALPALWPKVVNLHPEKLGVNFADSDVPTTGWEMDPPVFGIDDGQIRGDLWQYVRQAYNEDFVKLMEDIGLADVTEDETRSFHLHLERKDGGDLAIIVEGEERTIFLINSNGRGYSLRSIDVEGKLDIQVSKIPLRGARLGEVDVNFAFGEGIVAGRDALLVITEAGETGTLTVRIRPEKTPEAGGEATQGPR